MPEAVGGEMPERIGYIGWLVELRMTGVFRHQLQVAVLKPFVKHETVFFEYPLPYAINQCEQQNWLCDYHLAMDFRLTEIQDAVGVVGIGLLHGNDVIVYFTRNILQI